MNTFSLDQCAGADFVVAEFVRRRQSNLTYQNYPNYDHGFFEHNAGNTICRHDRVMADILDWIARNAAQETDSHREPDRS